MAQTTSLPNPEDFFMSEWPAPWATDQLMGPFDAPPGPGLVADVTPMPSNTPDITATNDIRSLYIMICCRLDKIESTLARIDGETTHTRDNMERTVEVSNQIKDMVDALRKSLGAFSKILFSYLRGDDGAGAKTFGSD